MALSLISMARWFLIFSATVASFAFVSRTDFFSEVLDVVFEVLSDYLSGNDFLANQDHLGLCSGSAKEEWDVLRHMGGNSPWIQKTEGIVNGSSIDVLPGCRVDQVHMVGCALYFSSKAFF